MNQHAHENQKAIDEVEVQTVCSEQLSLDFDPAPFLQLRILGETYADTQANRIACVNRMERGGLSPDMFVAQIEAMKSSEHNIELALVRNYRQLVRSLLPGVDAWQKSEFGIGEKLLARLLGNLGHPRIATPYHWEGDGANRKLIPDMWFERGVAQLWTYCGHGDPSLKKRKGMSAEEAFMLGNPRLKMLTHLLAEAAMKCAPNRITDSSDVSAHDALDHDSGEAQACLVECEIGPDQKRRDAQCTSVTTTVDQRETDAHVGNVDNEATTTEPKASNATSLRRTYRGVYDERRLVTTERLHAAECVRCGPSGKPALVGSPWSKAHQHADALRIVGKSILRDLWVAAG